MSKKTAVIRRRGSGLERSTEGPPYRTRYEYAERQTVSQSQTKRTCVLPAPTPPIADTRIQSYWRVFSLDPFTSPCVEFERPTMLSTGGHEKTTEDPPVDAVGPALAFYGKTFNPRLQEPETRRPCVHGGHRYLTSRSYRVEREREEDEEEKKEAFGFGTYSDGETTEDVERHEPAFRTGLFGNAFGRWNLQARRFGFFLRLPPPFLHHQEFPVGNGESLLFSLDQFVNPHCGRKVRSMISHRQAACPDPPGNVKNAGA
ncbi:hypothetical protein ACLOJK_023872 [Asimina triloba]